MRPSRSWSTVLFGILAVTLTLVAAACSSSSSDHATSPTVSSTSPAAIGGSATSAPTTGSKRPNVLFVLTDDLDLGEVAQMPNVKKLLAAQGTSFSHYYASVSLCCPSRSTTLRGQYSHNTGVETNGGTNGGFETAHRLGLESSTIGTWMQAAGYRTALIGKYLNGYPDTVAETYVPPGWNEFDSAAAGNPYSEYRYTLNENGRLVHYGSTPADYGTDVYVRKTAAFVTAAAKAKQPFLAYLAVYAPHQPATPAPQDARSFPGAKAPRGPAYNEVDVSGKPAYIRDRPLMTPQVQRRVDRLYRRRIQSLQAVDRGVGKLLATLQTNGQLDNTYIVFTSDNGFHLGQFRMPSGKQTAYDFDIHLPLIVRGPGVPRGRTVDQVAGNVDLAPTMAAMGGAVVPSFVDGRSLLPLLTGAAPASWRNAYLVEHWKTTGAEPSGSAPLEPADPDQAGTTDPGSATTTPTTRLRLGAAAASPIPEFHGIRTARYLYVEYSTGERELYDTKADPDELHNLAGTAPASLLRSLATETQALRTCKAATCRSIEARPVPG